MFRILGAFILHRLFLVLVAFAAVNFSGQTTYVGDDSLPNLKPIDRVWHSFKVRFERLPEADALKKIAPLSSKEMWAKRVGPFLWMAKTLSALFRNKPTLALILLSNLLFLFFLAEVFALLSRMVTSDMATAVGTMLVLWPASYELSLGSGFTMICFLAVRAVRAGLDGEWGRAGIALGLLAFEDPVAWGIVPLSIGLFVYFQRGQPAVRSAQSALLFLAPASLGLWWNYRTGVDPSKLWSASAFGSLYESMRKLKVGWTFSHSVLGQTITLFIFLAGTAIAVLQAAVGVHRVLPIAFLLLWLGFSPYSALASRAPLAGVCLNGLTEWRWLSRILHGAFLSLGAQEVFSLFS